MAGSLALLAHQYQSWADPKNSKGGWGGGRVGISKFVRLIEEPESDVYLFK